MSVLSHQTNVTDKSYFFQLANVSTLVADNIQVKNISSLTSQTGLLTASAINADIISTNFLNVSSLESANIIKAFEFSSVYTYNDIGVISTLFTEHIILDQATLDVASGNVLLLNGFPIATTQNLSSIADWSLEPAISTVEMLGNNILGAGNITCQNIFNALNIQTDTLSALTGVTAPTGTITNIRATNISSTNLMSSNANIPTSLTFGRGSGTSLAMGTLSSSSIFANTISTGTINGIPIISGSNWSQYPATSAVNMNGYDITGGSQPVFTISATSNLSETAGMSYSNTVDRGIDVTGAALINLNAKNGLQGAINIQADAGVAGVFGRVDITANGGTTGGIGTGGLINITANTPLGFSNATSAIKINAAGVNSYAGAIPPIGSLAGYNFIYGMGGVNICAGLPSALPNTVGTTYIYGTTGVEIPSDAYMKYITPYWDGLTTPPDLKIEGRYILPNLAQVCVRMSNVKQIDFQENFGTYLSNCDVIGMSSNGNIITSNFSATNATIGTLSNTNIIGTGAVSGYTTVGTNNINTNFINSLPVASYLATTSSFTTASISSATISSINGLAYSAPTNKYTSLFTSSFAFSTATSVGSNTNYNYPIFIDYDQAGNTTTAGVAIAVQGHNYSGGAVVNRIEIGARATGENYIMSVWPGQNLEELVIDATDVNFRDSDGFSTIVNQNPYGVATNGIIKAPTLSTSALYVSSLNDFISYGSKSFRLQGDVAQIQLSNNNPGGSGTILNLLSRVDKSEIQSFDSNLTTPLPLFLNSAYTSTASLYVSSINGQPYPIGPIFGEFLTTTTITVSAANTPTVIPFDTNTVSNGTSLVSGAIEVAQTGLYEFLISIQLDKALGSVDICDFWIRVNGTDVANTGSQTTVQGTNGEVLAACSYYLSLNATDKIEIVFASTDSTMAATYFPPLVTPGDPYDRPAVPAVIANIKLIK